MPNSLCALTVNNTIEESGVQGAKPAPLIAPLMHQNDAISSKPIEPELIPGSEEYKRHLPQTSIDEKDRDTKDNWVPRHPELIRLTGRHPFNVEPPPARLMESYITPPSLHYVRNHGAVPQIKWEEHRITVNGINDGSRVFTMNDILQFPTIDVTCTLTCAGNRRKEQNMVKQTIGFNWGPSGTSCSTWTGVRLGDLLRACGVDAEADAAKHVCMRGPKGELPKGDDGSYGTSITMRRAMDPSFDVVLAYKQNGRLLTPDHGFPIRIIIPGYIGGRMIKWLEEITVSDQESQNFYHFHDNRVLPSVVDEARANEEGWWYKPDFIINDLNINSAIMSPGHDETLPLSQSSYTIRGYAYSNGNKIIRCEVSLDDGENWKLAEIHQRHAPNPQGKHWAWVWWELDVPIAELLRSNEIVCRAWDSAMNTQPNTFTWNVMGMMNNCIYKVKVHPVQTTAGFGLQFEHPTIAGPTVGGWMNRADKPALIVEGPSTPSLHSSGSGQVYTMEEVEKHDTKDSAWFVYDGRVYDATPFLKEHPGGADSILLVAGTDATEEFDAIHSAKAKKMLMEYCIGDLAGAALPNGAAPVPTAAKEEDLVALNPKKKISFKLIEKHELSHNVRRFRFGLQSEKHRFGLPVGKHVFLYAKINDDLVMRAYTPTSSDDNLGYFDLVVKIYRAKEHPRFPDGGKMSQHLDTLAIGDTIDVKGPVGHVHWLGYGKYTLDGEDNHCENINMIAGGTGITPCYQVIKSIVKHADDKTNVALLYANQSPDDILLKEELDDLAANYSNFKVWYTVDKADDDWPFSVGFINEDMVRQHLFPGNDSTVSMLCGPPPMIKFACLPNLEKVGFTPEQCIQF